MKRKNAVHSTPITRRTLMQAATFGLTGLRMAPCLFLLYTLVVVFDDTLPWSSPLFARPIGPAKTR